MRRTLRLTLISIALIGTTGFSVYWGQTLGGASRHGNPNLTLSSLAPLRANRANNLAQDPNPSVSPEQVFQETLEKIQKEFVEGTGTDARLTEGALTRMLASLDDPKTFYLSPTLRKIMQNAAMGHFQGIGAIICVTKRQTPQADLRQIEVVAVLPGSPAEKSGLQTHDIILSINDRRINPGATSIESDRASREKTTEENVSLEPNDLHLQNPVQKKRRPLSTTHAIALLMTKNDAHLKLTVQRTNSPSPIEMQLQTVDLELKPVEFQVLPGQVGYLRVRQFNSISTKQFQEALVQIGKLKKLIVDLRGNFGGVFSMAEPDLDAFASARKLLSALTKGGKVALIERHPNLKAPLVIQGSTALTQIPMVVLIDGGCANLSEMTAAALRDSAGAKLIGSHTFGDNTLQLFHHLRSGGAIEVATAHLFTEKGIDLERGLEPDVIVLPNDGVKDSVLEIALQKLGG